MRGRPYWQVAASMPYLRIADFCFQDPCPCTKALLNIVLNLFIVKD